MATIKITLDKRSTNKNGAHPVRVFIFNKNTIASIITGINVTTAQFDGRDPAHTVTTQTVNAKAINSQLLKLYTELQQFIFDLNTQGGGELTASEIKRRFARRQIVNEETTAGVSFTHHFNEIAKNKTGKYGDTYLYTKKWLQKFRASEIEFYEIDYLFLREFDEFLRANNISPNTRGIIFRNMRTVFNDAIKCELTEKYPFRQFKMPHQQKEKEHLRLDDFRRLLAYKPQFDGEQRAKDLFLLSFYFCGANPVDIFNMPAAQNGYIKFVRTKTQSKSQNNLTIKIQPEAAEIINRYKGSNGKLLNFCDNYLNYENFYHFHGKKIRALAQQLEISGLSFYWARYSWATFASRLGVDESVIGRALGHAPSSLAGRVYITFDWERVDEANRRVINYLFGK